MERELLYENTWMIEDAGVRIFILKGSEKTLVIDTGRSGLDLRPELQDDTPYELLNTHADPDHIAGNCFLKPSICIPPKHRSTIISTMAQAILSLSGTVISSISETALSKSFIFPATHPAASASLTAPVVH